MTGGLRSSSLIIGEAAESRRVLSVGFFPHLRQNGLHNIA